MIPANVSIGALLDENKQLRAELARRDEQIAAVRGAQARAEVLAHQFDAFQSALLDALPDAEPDWEPSEIVAAVRELAGERCPDCGLWHRTLPDGAS